MHVVKRVYPSDACDAIRRLDIDVEDVIEGLAHVLERFDLEIMDGDMRKMKDAGCDVMELEVEVKERGGTCLSGGIGSRCQCPIYRVGYS